MIPMSADQQREERKSPDRKRLDAIERRALVLQGSEITLIFDSEGTGLEIARPKTHALKGADGQPTREFLARFSSEAGTDEALVLAASPSDVRFLLGLLSRATRRVKELAAQLGAGDGEQSKKQGKDFAAEAAMKLGDAQFQAFLGADSATLADIRLKARLGIESKSELNTDPDAASRWRDLRAEFSTWMAQ